MKTHLMTLGLLLALGGCGDDDDKGDATGDTGDSDAPVTYAATWDGMLEFFGDNCDRCHPSDSFSDIDLRTDVPADVTSGDGRLVVAGDPLNSSLWLVVSGQSLLIMPQDLGLLPEASVAHVEEWILAGAPVD